MRVLRLLFLTVHSPSRPAEGLPLDEGQAFASAWLVPAHYALRQGFLPQETLGSLLDSPTRAKASETAVGLWSAQQDLCAKLAEQGVDARGLPPLGGRALEGFFLPTGRFWMGAYCPSESLPQSQEAIARAFGSIFGHPAQRSRTLPFPWLNEFGRSGAWALGATQAFGDSIDALGSQRPPSGL